MAAPMCPCYCGENPAVLKSVARKWDEWGEQQGEIDVWRDARFTLPADVEWGKGDNCRDLSWMEGGELGRRKCVQPMMVHHGVLAFRDHLRVKPHVTAKVDAFWQSAGLGTDARVIGIHLRGSDAINSDANYAQPAPMVSARVCSWHDLCC